MGFINHSHEGFNCLLLKNYLLIRRCHISHSKCTVNLYQNNSHLDIEYSQQRVQVSFSFIKLLSFFASGNVNQDLGLIQTLFGSPPLSRPMISEFSDSHLMNKLDKVVSEIYI